MAEACRTGGGVDAIAAGAVGRSVETGAVSSSVAARASWGAMPGSFVTVTIAIADGLLSASPPAWLRLLPDDLRRMRAYRREEDVRRFVTGRALVACMARQILGDSAHDLRFSRLVDEVGERKPRFAWTSDPAGPPDLPEVSISHSGHLVVVAFAMGFEVGVDVEMHKSFSLPFTGAEDPVMRIVLTPQERARLHSRGDAAEAFTAKEAVLKAVGWGLAIDPLLVEIIDNRVTRFDAPQARAVSIAPLIVPGEASAHVAIAPLEA
ncbi:4'-phosphopantetheinyl transferase family protein [Devriesea agamarum]|uniref:4'-phosphopantetheinyl transferase family protein n=1 Tax=Devriesea agamarum TaxID=472569 RepID=UPI00071E3B71|nr:4'-phosphopantetheinyl transferase superfamily protein [Devriesea agamarum]